MSAAISARAKAVTAYSYAAFPVPDGAVDLRGDGAPLLPAVIDWPPGVSALERYGDIAGNANLRAALGATLGVPADQVIITNGGSEALHLALLTVTDPGDLVLLPRPAFPGFDQLAGLVGLRPAYYPVPGPVPPGCDAAATIVCTPHNPTGITTPRTSVSAARRGWIIWDICHAPFGDASPLAHPLAANEIAIFSLSKMLRLPGARIGCLITAAPDLHAAVVAAKTHLSMPCSQLSQRLAETVLTDPSTRPTIVARTVALVNARAQVTQALTRTGTFTVDAADAGTHLLAHTTDASSDAWARLRDVGVVGLPGEVFAAPATAARLCVSQPEPVIDHAVARLEAL